MPHTTAYEQLFQLVTRKIPHKERQKTAIFALKNARKANKIKGFRAALGYNKGTAPDFHAVFYDRDGNKKARKPLQIKTSGLCGAYRIRSGDYTSQGVPISNIW